MTWTIVLAGGTGSRLASECNQRYGYARPKQFCDFDGNGTLLEHTLARARVFSPPERIVVVTARAHRAEADEVLRDQGDLVRVEQPCPRDTTPAVSAGLLAVLARDPTAHIIVMPSDHHVADARCFARALEQANELVDGDPEGIALLGAVPDGPCDGYGWVVPQRATASGVEEFCEKPSAAEAACLIDRGAVVNTLVTVAHAAALTGALERHSPRWWRTLAASPDEASLEEAYTTLPGENFSTDVLEHIPQLLRLVRIEAEAGWSDIGTPARLARALAAERAARPRTERSWRAPPTQHGHFGGRS